MRVQRILRAASRTALLLAGLAGLMAAAGCRYTTTPADLLLTPRSTPGNAALTEALHGLLPVTAKLAVVTHESSNASILQLDGDGDGRMEAFVVFADESGTTRVMVLEQSGTSWKRRFVFAESSAYGVDVLRVADLDRDGRPELMIGWNQFGEPQHMLTLYHMPPSEDYPTAPKPIAELPYDTMGIGDGNGDGNPEIGLVTLHRLKMTASIGLYQFREDKVSKVASALLDGSVNGYMQVTLGQLAPGKYGVTTDAAIGANSSISTMMVWSAGKLVRIYPPQTSSEDNVQTNANAVLSGDANGDGIIDVHVLREAPGQSEGVPYSGLLWIEEYRQWDGKNGFYLAGSRYYDSNGMYEIGIPLSWSGYTFRRPAGGGSGDIALDAYDVRTGEREEILTVRTVPLADWGSQEGKLQNADSRYLELGRGNGLVYFAVWHDRQPDDGPNIETEAAKQGDFPPDEAEMKRLFKLLP
ncbi:VCBS repeat-containing protein [Paenibacillus lycopersici]|uniref:VCBS repeat-containing protein n=1 Tax=Paenibacillus lycopersici TaxID=2704462 RepID=A0A6C0G3J4_9BACL|nr:VCBS repeat-containing protein [Paenibacillus lycopersici]QHT59325.1 VCBS repeat-containing protein [Paenibacillus lycopersici]